MHRIAKALATAHPVLPANRFEETLADVETSCSLLRRPDFHINRAVDYEHAFIQHSAHA